jgi:hypothetical protein
MTNPQDQIRDYLRARGIATSPELVQISWDFRRCISRLRKQGMQIVSRPTPGKNYSTYVLYEGQVKLL